MMNYCIINGKKSTMVKGLMIQALPPIIKPLIRSKIEEIDGRDGDIITNLGYASYDREMPIGLFGDYDIGEVIRYFDAEGDVIFSNELDKVYHFKILNQINFERLGRFKTAKVVFHVEPFKYPSTDDTLTLNGSAESKNAYLTNYGNVNAKPIIEIIGCPSYMSLNLNNHLMYIDSPAYTHIIIDIEKQNAYYVAVGSRPYANRVISGDPYADFVVEPNGLDMNHFKWTGNCTSIKIKNMTRWI